MSNAMQKIWSASASKIAVSFCALQLFLLSNVDCLLKQNILRRDCQNSKNQIIQASNLRAVDESAITVFENSWVVNDIAAKSVKHTSFDWVCGKLRGLQATTGQYKKGSTVISIPAELTLSASDGGMQGCPEGLESRWKDLKGTSRVSLLLMKEWLTTGGDKKNKNKFASYIDTLPTPGSLGTPFHWSEEFLSSFPYKPLVKSVSSQKKSWTELYAIVKATPDFKGVSYERFVWAMEIVRSRAFTGLGSTGKSALPLAGAASLALLSAAVVLTKTSGVNEAIPIVLGSLGALCLLPSVLTSTQSSCVLLPAIDSSNHDGSNPLCSISLEPTRGRFEMTANREINAGEQITISYGDRNNDDLLQYFGFVEVNCEFDRYVVQDPRQVLKEELEEKSTGNSDNADTSFLKQAIEMLGNNMSTAESGMIVTRGDFSSWKMGSLEGLKDPILRNKCVRTILASERRRIEKGMIDIAGTDSQPEINLCLIKTFLSEKLNVLSAASAKVSSN